MQPEKKLKRFAKVALALSKTQMVAFTLDRTALAFYHPSRKRGVVEPGVTASSAGRPGWPGLRWSATLANPYAIR
jgi:hypothetical protein